MLAAVTGEEIGELTGRWRRAGESIAFVPTMGNLHAGHLELVHAARALAGRVVVSVFVNPLQFNDGADLAAYPRTPEEDRALLDAAAVDALFMPAAAEIYPRGMAAATRIEVPGLSTILCGAFRPGHFTGVATVVAALFNLVRPDAAVFGEKDYQQLLVIRRLVEDLHLPLRVVGVATVREEDGLAYSSRNRYLAPAERRRAPELYRALCAVRDEILVGRRDYSALEASALRALEAAGFRPEYLGVRRANDLEPAGPADRDLRVLAAAHLGRARLIDNVGLTLLA
ncbi:MAG: pantoate--beta-alanine ligase [Gammaproteobacteria bacterium]|nr:pantoate--beta-alanine ligase [Gammaproteobacteria bacterium]